MQRQEMLGTKSGLHPRILFRAGDSSEMPAHGFGLRLGFRPRAFLRDELIAMPAKGVHFPRGRSARRAGRVEVEELEGCDERLGRIVPEQLARMSALRERRIRHEPSTSPFNFTVSDWPTHAVQAHTLSRTE